MQLKQTDYHVILTLGKSICEYLNQQTWMWNNVAKTSFTILDRRGLYCNREVFSPPVGMYLW